MHAELMCTRKIKLSYKNVHKIMQEVKVIRGSECDHKYGYSTEYYRYAG